MIVAVVEVVLKIKMNQLLDLEWRSNGIEPAPWKVNSEEELDADINLNG